jgi:hypothetical protein
MSRPKGAFGCGTIWEEQSPNPGHEMKEMIESTRFPGEEKEVDKPSKFKPDDATRLLNAQNGRSPNAPALSPVEAKPTITKAPKITKEFTADTKKDLIKLVTSNGYDLEEVSNTKIIFADTDGNQYVLMPV